MQSTVTKSYFHFENFQKEVVKSAGRINVSEIARITGLDRRTISKVIDGEFVSPDKMEIGVFIALCDWMQKDVNEFIK